MQFGNRFLMALALVFSVASAMAQGAFTYQGRLENGGAPANGLFDFQFALYAVPAAGPVLVLTNRGDLNVVNGLFTTEISGFDAHLAQGAERWLEIRVRPGDSVGAYTTLTPRIPLTSAPYAFFSHRPWVTNANGSISYTQGSVGIGDNSPVAALVVGNGDKFQVSGSTGAIRFTDPQAGLLFPSVSTASQPMIRMFEDGTSNARRMVIAHSESFTNWGLEYQDDGDRFHFRNVQNERFSVSMQGVGVVGINHPEPHPPLTFANTFGPKVSFAGVNSAVSYGIGVQQGEFQIYTPSMSDDIVFGVGPSQTFAENVRIKGNGLVQVNTTLATARINVDGFGLSGLYAVSAAGSNFGSVWGRSTSSGGNAVVGEVTGLGSPYAIYGIASGAAATAYAGYFQGRIAVVGNSLVTGTKSFRIDHPLDPENKYLYHYSVESDEVLNMYRGVVTLDANGEATVTLADYIQAINRSFAYTLTPIGASMPNLFVAQEMENASFKIAGGVPGKKVSWMVTAQRNDRHVQKHGAPVEEWKPEALRGSYQDATLFGLPAEESESFKRDRGEAEPKR